MGKRYIKSENKIIERAILFLVHEYTKTGFNEKPVIFHSLRVACRLVETDSPTITIVAAILHDLIEDSEVKLSQIRKNFGNDVAKLVDAVSFKSNISNKKQQYIEMFKRIKKVGREAFIIKCADILDNSDYYSFGNNQDSEKLLLNKFEYFLTVAESRINNFPLFTVLKRRYYKLLAEYKSVYKRNSLNLK